MNLYTTLNFSSRRKTPLILQTEAAECGLACLAMVASYYGYDTDLASLRQRHSISLKGATLTHLIKIAGQLKLATRPIKVEIEDLNKLVLPAILHWDFNHFVVLTQVRGHKLELLDPGCGRRNLSLDEVSKHFTGVALELAPAQDFEHKVERRQVRLSQLIGRMPGLGRALTQVFLLAGALEVFAHTITRRTKKK